MTRNILMLVRFDKNASKVEDLFLETDERAGKDGVIFKAKKKIDGSMNHQKSAIFRIWDDSLKIN